MSINLMMWFVIDSIWVRDREVLLIRRSCLVLSLRHPKGAGEGVQRPTRQSIRQYDLSPGKHPNNGLPRHKEQIRGSQLCARYLSVEWHYYEIFFIFRFSMITK